MNVVLFGLDIEDPLCSSFLDALLAAGAAHGVHLRWGSVRGDSLTLAMDGSVSQEEILQILESKAMHSNEKHPSTSGAVSHTPAPSIFAGEG